MKTEDRAARPEVIVQYQVGSRETLAALRRRNPRARPDLTERTRPFLTIYSERPAKVGKLGEVSETVRHYDSFRVHAACPQRRCSQMAGLLRRT